MENFVHSASETITDASIALQYLQEGNKRFVSGIMIHRKNNDAEWHTMQQAQHPFAAILSCSDSRVSPSVIFDQKNGDLFTVRNAGNIVDSVSLGSLEYAVKYLEIPLIVVVGHKDCGAVNAAFHHLEDLPENLNRSLQCIVNSIEGQDDINDAEIVHVCRMADIIREDAAVIEAGTKVVEAYYDIDTGIVHWLEDCDQRKA